MDDDERENVLWPFISHARKSKPGVRMFEDLMSQLKSHEVWALYCQTSYMLGKIYLKMAQEKEKRVFPFAKNIGFLIKTLPL